MNKMIGQVFKNQTLPLDDHHYENCTIDSCQFLFSGLGNFVLRGNHISGDTHFVFAGHAKNTLMALRDIYEMGDWGRRHVLSTFETIAPDLKKMN